MNAPTSDAKTIFGRAIDIKDAAARAAYLDQACSSNDQLRAEIDSLLRAHFKVGDFLKGPAHDAATCLNDADSGEEGMVIGPYKLLERLGEGGFGVVFMAEQHVPVRRRVALKIIKPGMDSRQVLARFEVERQALALMEHPNIARALDAGVTDSGRPYFVMELIRGVPITDYCDQANLAVHERLELFVQVCRAVQHAHQKGIIHRDLKPSNILITLLDGRPVPKVIDFGIVKAINQPLTQETLFTRLAEMIGTPLYMSPEQAEMTSLDIDTRSDIYSLGVLLYELLTGSTPFDKNRLKQAAFDEIRRIIREEEPAKPSTRISTLGEKRSVVAAHRHADPNRLSQLLRGDLDWIVMKALEKDRSRRYETANGLAVDVERHLADEPVLACPPSAAYRFRKFARRNRVVLSTAAIVALALIAGIVISTWQAVRATVAEKAADDRKREADEAKGQAEKQRDELANLNQTLRRANYIGDMNLAQQAWEANNLVRTRQLVELHAPKPGEGDLRSFEWNYLQRLLHSDRLTINAHAGLVSRVAFTPDGRRLFSSGKSRPNLAMEALREIPGEIKLWNAATGEALSLALDVPSRKVANLALSADGTRLAAACGTEGIQVWNLLTGERFDLKSRAKEIYGDVAFSPDGKRLVSSSEPEADAGRTNSWWARIWDLASRQESVILDKSTFGFGNSPIFSPDGKSVAIVPALARSVRVVDSGTARELFSVKAAEGFIFRAIFSPDGKSLATCGPKGGPIVWDVASHEKRITCQSAAHYVDCLAYRPDGKQLASGSMEGLIEIWNAGSGQKTTTFKGHAGEIFMLAFSPDGMSLASAGVDGTIRIWDTSAGRDAVANFANTENVGPADLSPDGRTLLWENTADKRWHFADAITGAPKGEPIEIDEKIDSCFDWTADGTRLVAPVGEKKIVIYDASSGSALRTWQLDRDNVCIAAFAPDGEAFAYSAPRGKIRILNTQTGAERLTLEGLTGRVHNLAFSPDGSRLAGADPTGRVKVWEAARGREIASTRISQMQMLRIRFSPDGKRLGIVGNSTRFLNGEARILDIASGQITELRGHTILVVDIAFSPDGQRVATGSSDQTVRIWDAATGMEILTLHGHTQPVSRIRFLPDGQRLISSSMDGTVRVWDGTPGSR